MCEHSVKEGYLKVNEETSAVFLLLSPIGRLIYKFCLRKSLFRYAIAKGKWVNPGLITNSKLEK